MKIGSKVLCVKKFKSSDNTKWKHLIFPIKGSVYTIRECNLKGATGFTCLLEEIKNKEEYFDSIGWQEPRFVQCYFIELVEYPELSNVFINEEGIVNKLYLQFILHINTMH